MLKKIFLLLEYLLKYNYKYLILSQILVLNIINQSLLYSAANIAAEQSAEDIEGALINVIFNDKNETAKELINGGYNINYVNKGRKTALFWAIKKDNKEIVKLLLESGVIIDPNEGGIKYKDVINPLDLALELGRTEIAKMIEDESARRRPFELIKKLGEAINDQNIKRVKELINEGADINALDRDGVSILEDAITIGNKEIIELLLKAGVNIDNIKQFALITLNYSTDGNLISKMLQDEPARRESVINDWLKKNRVKINKEIRSGTTEKLIPDIERIITDYYTINYTDIPLEDRLAAKI